VNDVTCPDVEALAAELALGSVSGPERATALSHLSRCASCRRLVDELSAAADPLLLLTPEAEPSIGFESRVLAAALGAADGGPAGTDRPAPGLSRTLPRRSRSRLARAAVAAAVVAVAAFAGLLAGLSLERAPDGVRTALAVSANGRATCRAFAYGEQQAWVFVSLEAPREWTADYRVEVTTEGGGTAAALGTLRLEDGGGTLGATVDVPASRLRAIRVFDPSGALRYEAPFG
jgi:anti-sigma-K factor RskA